MEKYRARGAELDWTSSAKHTYFRPIYQSLARHANAGRLRCNRLKLEPHTAGWPAHWHTQEVSVARLLFLLALAGL